MLMTKHKVQELVENAKIDLGELEKYAGVEVNDDGAILVSSAIEMLKNNIMDKIERLP